MGKTTTDITTLEKATCHHVHVMFLDDHFTHNSGHSKKVQHVLMQQQHRKACLPEKAIINLPRRNKQGRVGPLCALPCLPASRMFFHANIKCSVMMIHISLKR